MDLCNSRELVDLVKRGDMEALDRITRCYSRRLIEVGRRWCRNEEEARDAVQDALLAAGTHLNTFRGEGSIEGWLIRMVVNACHHMRRGRKNDPNLHDPEATLPSGAISPEQEVARRRLALALGEAMEELPPEDRVILLLSEAEDWTGPEIARELGLSPGAVRTRLTRIRTRLRDRLSRQGWGSEGEYPTLSG